MLPTLYIASNITYNTETALKTLTLYLRQEPITRSVQLPHIPVTACSQIDLFLVWIYREFRPRRNLSDQSQAGT